MAERKIIQIAATPEFEATGGYCFTVVVALCSDGTVWKLQELAEEFGGIVWERVPPIPQD